MFERETWLKLRGLCPVDDLPKLPCPYCASNSLVVEKESLIVRPLSGFALEQFLNRFSTNNKVPAEYEKSTWAYAAMIFLESYDAMVNQPSHFAGFFCCKVCNQSVAAMGLAKKSSLKEPRSVLSVKVEGFNPSVPIIPLRSFVPASINHELIRSFAYYHSDVCASGSMLRRAVEKTCLELGYKQRTLHASIESLKQDYPEEGRLLEALKLVGNEATHSDGVDEEDILDSYEVLSLVLEIFRRKEVTKKAHDIAERFHLKHGR